MSAARLARTIGFPCGYRVQMRRSHSIESVIRDINTHRTAHGCLAGKISLVRNRGASNFMPVTGQGHTVHISLQTSRPPGRDPPMDPPLRCVRGFVWVYLAGTYGG